MKVRSRDWEVDSRSRIGVRDAYAKQLMNQFAVFNAIGSIR